MSKAMMRILVATGMTLGIALATQAANGTWINTTSGGLWSTPGNWSGGTIADGSGASANFNTVDITSDNTVHLDAPRTLSTLTFGDTDTASAADWMLDNNGNVANILTLAGGTPTITVNALGTGKSATLGVKLNSSSEVIKDGAGTLTLANDNTLGGKLTVKAGALEITSGYNAIANTFSVGDTGSGATYQSGGAIRTASQMWLGNGKYGYYELSGGSLTNAHYLQLGLGNGMGLFYLNGGTQLITSANPMTLGNTAGTNVYYATAGVLSSSPYISVGHTGASNGRNTLTVAGKALVSSNNSVILGNSSTVNTGIHSLNLDGGVLQIKSVYKGNANGGLTLVNFDGGTLQASAAGTLMGPGAGGVGAVNKAHVFAGGAVIDSAGFDVILSQNLLPPPGNGVTGLVVTAGGSGYIGAPYVSLDGGGGTNATAVALFDKVSGSVTGVVVTSCGYGYTSAPTATLLGGGGSGATLSTPVIAANVSGGVVKLGSGKLTLTGTNTCTGVMTVMSGTLAACGVAGSFSGGSEVTARGTGTLMDGDTIAANNNGVTDRILNTTALKTADSGTFALAFPAAGQTHAQTFARLEVTPGAGTITTANAAVGTANLTFTGASGSGFVRDAGGFVNVISAPGFNPAFGNAPTALGGSSVAGTANPILVGAFLDQSNLVAAASGVLVPAALQTTWDVGETDNNVDVTANLAAGNAAVNSLRFNDATARTLTLGGGVTTNVSGMILCTGAAGITQLISGGTLTSGNGKDLAISVNNSETSDRRDAKYAALQITSVIADNGATPVALSFSGPSSGFQGGASVYLNNSVNSYSGNTYLSGVGLFIKADQTLGAVPVSARDNIFALSGYTGLANWSGGALTLNANRNIVISSGASFLFASGGWTVPGRISGSGTLYVNETGGPGSNSRTLLTGDNSEFTGNILVAGYLRADEGAGLSPKANLALGDNLNGVLETHGTFTRAPGTGAGQVQIGTAILNWYGGFSAVGGALTLNFGNDLRVMTWGDAAGIAGATKGMILQDNYATDALTWQNPIALGSAARAIRVNSATQPATVSGVISGSGSLAKDGVGTLVLTATNTYAGVTTINAGTLQIGDGVTDGTLGLGGVNNKTKLVITCGGSYTVTNLISGAGTLTLNGSGTVTLAAANGYTGLTTVTNGTLAAGCDNALTNGAALTLSNGAFDAGSFSNALGTLTLTTGTANTLAIHGAASRLSFTNLNASATGTLVITGSLEPTALRIGTDASGLTQQQRAYLSANGKKVFQDALGYLHEVPPGTLIIIL